MGKFISQNQTGNRLPLCIILLDYCIKILGAIFSIIMTLVKSYETVSSKKQTLVS